jgi:hypothetical protein
MMIFFNPYYDILILILFCFSGNASHQLSATALLPSPDGPPHPRPLDLFQFREEESRRSPRRSQGLWDCLLGCRRRVEHSLAKRRVSLFVIIFLTLKS